ARAARSRAVDRRVRCTDDDARARVDVRLAGGVQHAQPVDPQGAEPRRARRPAGARRRVSTPAPPLWRNRDFMLLQAGQLLSTFGSGISGIAYPLLTLAVTGSAAKAGY